MVRAALDEEILKMPQEVQDSTWAALCRSLASKIDDGNTPVTALPGLSKAYQEAYAQLRALAPSEQEEDELDAIRKRLDRRTAA